MNPHHKVVMVPRAMIIIESEVSTRLRFYVHPITQQYQSRIVRKDICNQSSHYENTMVPHTPVII